MSLETLLPPRPDSEALLARSEWAAARPDLAEDASRWMRTLPAEREALARRAVRLARPSADPASLLALARTGLRVLDAAGPEALGDLVGVAGRVLRFVPVPRAGDDDHRRAERVQQAERLVRAGGPVYVKLGQFIATARGLLPDVWVDGFGWCRDEVPPLPTGAAEQIIERTVGRSTFERFRSFDPEPLAAASIAQVHAATLADGSDVVAKVRRPGLRGQFESDIRALALLSAATELVSAEARIGNVSGFVELFSSLVLEEIDFRFEALNIVELALASEDAGHGSVRYPRPIPGLVAPRVLVMERVPGVRYTDAHETYPEVVDGARLVRLAIEAVLEHTLVYGVFHGDLHAGNVLVDERGDLSLVDFGIVGRLPNERRVALVRFLAAQAMGDFDAQVELLHELGALPADAERHEVRQKLAEQTEHMRQAGYRAADGSAGFDALAADFGETLGLLRRAGYRLPKELVLFFKNLLYLNGFAAAVAPELNLVDEILPVFAYFAEKYPTVVS